MRNKRINWMKVGEALSVFNPYGPVFGPDGTIYALDGSMLVPPATATACDTELAVTARTVTVRPATARPATAPPATEQPTRERTAKTQLRLRLNPEPFRRLRAGI